MRCTNVPLDKKLIFVLHIQWPWVAEPFSKWGGQVHVKKLYNTFVVWIGKCDVTSIEILCHYLYTICRSKLHYFRQN